MNYTLAKKDGKVTISFTIPADEWELCMESAYQKNKHKYSEKGFRKGHVPRKVLEGVYGKGLFLEDAFDDSFSKYYTRVLQEHQELYPVEMPSVDFTSFDEKGFKFKAIVTLKPEVTLGKYTGLKMKKVKVEITDADIEGELKSVQDKNARLVEVDRAVEDGDEVTLDYSGSVDGVKFDGGTAQQQQLVIGSKTFIPGFEEQMIGMKKGEQRDIHVSFPKEYRATELAGKESVFDVTVHEIKAKEVQPIDDDFAKDFSEFDTLAEYKENIRKNLTEERQKQANSEEENALLEQIVTNATMSVPDCMIESQIDSYLEEFKYSLQYQGLKIEDYFKYTNSNEKDLRASYTDRAKRTVSTRLVLEEIVEKENIKVDDAKLQDKYAEMAKQSDKSVEDFVAGLGKEYIEYIANQLLTDTLIEFLRKNNTFE